MGAFTVNRYGTAKTFDVGQKVQCGYYHEYPRSYMKDAYKRTLWERLVDEPFKPVKLGVIVGDAGIHPFWLGKDRMEQYLLVKFREYSLPKPIPISCLDDAAEWAAKTRQLLEKEANNEDESGKTAHARLLKLAEDAEQFTSN